MGTAESKMSAPGSSGDSKKMEPASVTAEVTPGVVRGASQKSAKPRRRTERSSDRAERPAYEAAPERLTPQQP